MQVAGCSIGTAAKRTDRASNVEEAIDRGIGEADTVGAVHAAAQVAAAQEWHCQAAQCATRTAAAWATLPCNAQQQFDAPHTLFTYHALHNSALTDSIAQHATHNNILTDPTGTPLLSMLSTPPHGQAPLLTMPDNPSVLPPIDGRL